MLVDKRIETLAKNLVNYSCSVQKGENVLIEAFGVDYQLVNCVIKEVYAAGGYPFVSIFDNRIQRELYKGMDETLAKKMAEFDCAKMDKMDAYNINDLLKTHGIIMHLIAYDAGKFRFGNEGVFDENGNCVFMAPKPDLVPVLVKNLFKWMKENKDIVHPLILSSVFHYEFVFIHPFSDGNGRMARLWQNIILSKWKKIFEYVPIESQIKNYQEDYYKVIDYCNKSGNSNEFIEFMLNMINNVLTELLENTEKEITYNNSYVAKLLEVMDYNIPMTANEIMTKLNLKSKDSFRENYLNPALESGIIKMTCPDKKTSKNQKYYKD